MDGSSWSFAAVSLMLTSAVTNETFLSMSQFLSPVKAQDLVTAWSLPGNMEVKWHFQTSCIPLPGWHFPNRHGLYHGLLISTDLGLRCPFPVHPLTPATVTHGDPSHWSAPVPTVPSYLPHGKGKSSSPSLPGLLTCPASSLQNTGAKAVLESFVLIPKG